MKDGDILDTQPDADKTDIMISVVHPVGIPNKLTAPRDITISENPGVKRKFKIITKVIV